MKVSEILRKAAENTRGNWYQGEYESPEGDRHCVLGQIGLACGKTVNDFLLGFDFDTPEEKATIFLDKVIQEQYPDLNLDYMDGSVFKWNDHPGRTEEEVVAMLEKAAVLAEEKEL